MKCDPWLRRHALCLVYVTQSLVGASLFVFNLSAAKVCLFLQLLALLQKKMRTFLYLPLGDRYGSNLTRSLEMHCFLFAELQRQDMLSQFSFLFTIFFPRATSLIGKQSEPACFSTESEAHIGASGLTFAIKARL